VVLAFDAISDAVLLENAAHDGQAKAGAKATDSSRTWPERW